MSKKKPILLRAKVRQFNDDQAEIEDQNEIIQVMFKFGDDLR